MNVASVAEPFQSGKYRVVLELGQGGTANVYLAVAQGPVGFNKLVVLKALKPSLGSDPEFRRMFLNEARLSARLNHQNIVQVNEVIEYEGLPVIVMEYLEGKPLSEIRSRASEELQLNVHLRIISEALSGLHYSHELSDYDGTLLNVVHRDMTPHNVFVTYDGQVKVLDFGIAKLSGSLVETQTGVIKGKLRYMPPEQITGDKVDRRTDIFAVGVMLWEAAAGTRMWSNLSEAVIMNRVLNGEIPSPRDLRPEVAPELERIIMKALAYDPKERYATAAELQTELDAYLGDLSATVTLREIGQLITRLFETSRVQTRKVIEKQLSQASLASTNNKGAITFPPPALSISRSTYTSSNTYRIAEETPSPRSAWRRFTPLIAVVTAVAIGGATLWQLSAKRKLPVTPEATTEARAEAVEPAAEGPPAEPAASDQPQEIMLRITAFPMTAEILVDGKPLGVNPHMGSVLADGQEHQIEARAEGHVTATSITKFDKDVDLVLTLAKEKSPPRVLHPRAVRGTAPPPEPAANPTPTPSPAVKAGPDCSMPYYLDERGVKKWKTDCL